MILRSRLALVVLPILLVLAFPAAASAVYQVNSIGDAPDSALNGTCETATPGECTLRAAIQESNNSIGVVDTITFDPTVFEGKIADTITASSDLPTITDQVNVQGTRCETEAGAGIEGPCVGVVRSGGGSLFVVNADNVRIEGVAVTGAANGINVTNGADKFVAKNVWAGLNLKGEAVANTTGILLGPGADEAVIGGEEEAERNVVAGNSGVGLDLEGAGKAKILGNYFGVAPNGTTVRSNLKDIEITNSVLVAAEAKENEIGQAISLAKRSTPKCDGGCNVIAGATISGVDLRGDGSGLNEMPASGPTTIRGNYVGLGGNGETVVQNAEYGINVGGGDNVQVGGLAEGETNNFAGGLYGVYAENADNLDVLANVMGRDRSGAPASAPSTIGIFNLSGSVTTPSRIAYNSLEMSGGTGIEQRFTGAEILYNDVWGGATTGIVTVVSPIGEGNLVEGNRIRETTSDGIVIESDSNTVIANEVKEAGGAGILVKHGGPPFITETSGNQIGGDEEFEENELLFNSGPAIEIKDLESSNNEVARNHGEGNGGLFIDLVSAEPGTEPNGPNEGVKPPVITAAFVPSSPTPGFESMVSGTAEPGARVRVFRKESAEPGELGSFLGEATADGSGKWQIGLGSTPLGPRVAATQTNPAGGTSELATANTALLVIDGGCAFVGTCNGGNGGGNNNSNNNGGVKDKTPPDTKLVKAPPKKTHKTTVTFKFKSTEGASTFQCRLDRKPFRSCLSPKTYKKLKPGKHVFKVRAIDKAGNVDTTPAKKKFTVLR